jgi:hypothetical protein
MQSTSSSLDATAATASASDAGGGVAVAIAGEASGSPPPPVDARTDAAGIADRHGRARRDIRVYKSDTRQLPVRDTAKLSGYGVVCVYTPVRIFDFSDT